MHDVYLFVTGPMVWIAFSVFIIGSLWRLYSLIRSARRKEPFIFSYMSFRYGFRSIIHWLIPFGAATWRLHPVLTLVTFTFHLCLIITPIFLSAHIVLWEASWGIGWWSLPNGLADVMSFLVVAGGLFFLGRRVKQPEVKYVTTFSDYLLLGLVLTPFITGIICYHQWFAYRIMLILHVAGGEVMLMAIPFTRFVHMVFSPLTRAYMGSEFGGVRMARDW